jgi:hypothetical protein
LGHIFPISVTAGCITGVYCTTIDPLAKTYSMKTTILAYIAMLFSSLVLVSFMCCDAGGPRPTITPATTLHTFWDYTQFAIDRTDSSTHPYVTQVLDDTSFASMSQHSFVFNYNDSVVYTDYTVSPNTIQTGTYELLDTGYTGDQGKIVLFFPHTAADTLNFLIKNDFLEILTTVDSAHICDKYISYYNSTH